MEEKKRTEAPETSTTLLRDVADSQHATAKSCFFAYLDILGFKNIVKRTSSEQLKSIVEEFILECAKTIDESRSVWTNSGTVSSRIRLGPGVRVRFVSDSICVWSENDECLRQFDDMLHIVSSMLICGVEHGLPLRGAVTYGELFESSAKVSDIIPLEITFEANSLYGKALTEAYEAEGKTNWSGVVLTPKAWAKIVGEFAKGIESDSPRVMRSVNIRHAEDLFNHYPYFVWYDVPLKAGRKKAIAYNWNYCPIQKLSVEKIEQAFAGRCGVMENDVKRKLHETIRFYEYTQRVKELCDFGAMKFLPTPDSAYMFSDLQKKGN